MKETSASFLAGNSWSALPSSSQYIVLCFMSSPHGAQASSTDGVLESHNPCSVHTDVVPNRWQLHSLGSYSDTTARWGFWCTYNPNNACTLQAGVPMQVGREVHNEVSIVICCPMSPADLPPHAFSSAFDSHLGTFKKLSSLCQVYGVINIFKAIL